MSGLTSTYEIAYCSDTESLVLDNNGRAKYVVINRFLKKIKLNYRR